MSRILVSCLFSMLTAAPAIAAPQFAKPPPATTVTAPVEHVAEGVADRDTVRAKLLANRRANLERFRTYQARGEFPSNTYTDGLENVWIDADGHLCAAATIIKASGSGALVAQVGRDNNFIRLADVRDGALMDWMLTSGLTQEELVAIQRPFQGVGAGKPMVGRPVTVDPDKRTTETERLQSLYRLVEAKIVRDQRASLERAVDRLLASPDLAATFVAG